MSNWADFALIRPIRLLSREEIELEYNGGTRPIPEGFKKKRKPTIFERLNSEGAKPYAVFCVNSEGKRTFVSSHPTVDSADNKAVYMNEQLPANSDVHYVSGERQGSKGFIKHEETED